MARAFTMREVKVSGRKEPRYVAKLDENERDLVAGLMHQVAELIDVPMSAAAAAAAAGTEGGQGETEADPFDAIVAGLGMQISDESSTPGEVGQRSARPEHVAGYEDPAIRRLFPIANRTDSEAAAEFSRLSEGGLRQRKRDNLEAAAALLDRGDSLELTPAQAQTLLVALTDLRVVLGERMGLRTDEDAAELDVLAASLDDSDPRLHFILMYDFLTWLQESLAGALLKGLG